LWMVNCELPPPTFNCEWWMAFALLYFHYLIFLVYNSLRLLCVKKNLWICGNIQLTLNSYFLIRHSYFCNSYT
jgi:hypothetical protein